MTALQVLWFVLIGVLLAVYLLLDGFDLGVGLRYLFEKEEPDRRAMLEAVGPVWDGNEVWLLTGGGAVFAAFPEVYATVFSGLYLALALVLVGLILRAVSIEFRGQSPSPRWRAAWDVAFAVGSAVPALLLGVAMGNIMRGLPLDADKNFIGGFWSLLNPYALLTGVVGLLLLATHGAVYLALRTEGPLADRSRRWATMTSGALGIGFVAVAVVTVLTQERLLVNYRALPTLWLLPAVAAASIGLCCLLTRVRRCGMAFLCSCAAILATLASVAAGLFPNLVPALNDAGRSLTVVNASSSQLTLKIMLILTCLGLPVVLVYTAWAYWVFVRKPAAEQTV